MTVKFVHQIAENNATGFKDEETGEFVWEPVTWTKCWCGMSHSNRITPDSFWDREWENPKIKRTAGVLLWKRNQNNGRIYYFLVQSYGCLYGIPKGAIENNETTKESAIREFLEETGTDISEIFEVNKAVETRNSIGTKSVFSIFTIQVPWLFGIKTYPACDNEITSLGFVEKTKLKRFQLNRITKYIIERLKH